MLLCVGRTWFSAQQAALVVCALLRKHTAPNPFPAASCCCLLVEFARRSSCSSCRNRRMTTVFPVKLTERGVRGWVGYPAVLQLISCIYMHQELLQQVYEPSFEGPGRAPDRCRLFCIPWGCCLTPSCCHHYSCWWSWSCQGASAAAAVVLHQQQPSSASVSSVWLGV